MGSYRSPSAVRLDSTLAGVLRTLARADLASAVQRAGLEELPAGAVIEAAHRVAHKRERRA